MKGTFIKSNKTRAWLCAIGSTTSVSLRIVSSVVFAMTLRPLAEKFNCSDVEVMLITSILAIGTMVISTFITPIVLKYNPKVINALGGVCQAIYYLTIAFGSSIQVVWIGAVFYGIAPCLMGPLMNQTLVTNWFKTGVTKIFTGAMAIGSLLAVAFAPISASVYLHYGLNTLCLGAAIVSFVIVTAASLLLSRVPSYYGMEPVAFGKDNPRKGETYHELNMPATRIMKMPIVYVLLIGIFLCNIAWSLYSSQKSLVFLSFGLDTMSMAWMMSVMQIGQTIMTMTFGIVNDRFGPKISFSVSLGYIIVLFFALSAFNLSGVVIAFVVALTGEIGVSSIYFSSTMIPRFFGRKKGSFFFGWGQTATSLSTATAAPLSAYLASLRQGSYTIPFMVSGILFVVVIVFMLILYRQKVISKIWEIDKEYPAEAAA
jgi:sugar phosphate permease